MTGTGIMQTTPTELFHTSIGFIPNILDTAYEMLSKPEMIIVLCIGIIAGFLINISK